MNQIALQKSDGECLTDLELIFTHWFSMPPITTAHWNATLLKQVGICLVLGFANKTINDFDFSDDIRIELF